MPPNSHSSKSPEVIMLRSVSQLALIAPAGSEALMDESLPWYTKWNQTITAIISKPI